MTATEVGANEHPSAARDAGPGLLTRLRKRLPESWRRERPPALPPFPGIQMLRVTVGILLAAVCLLNVGGAVLLLLLWQQGRASGVLTTQLDRTWDLLGTLQEVERWVAYGLIAVGMCWVVLAALNASRATGRRRNPAIPALLVPLCAFGVWWVGREVVTGSDDVVTQVAGWAMQVAIVAVLAIAVTRIAVAAEARHGPLRFAFVVTAGYLAQLQFLGGLSNLDRDAATGEWGQLGAHLLMGGLILVVGSLALNEAERSIEDATQHRYELRSRFSESLLAQAAAR